MTLMCMKAPIKPSRGVIVDGKAVLQIATAHSLVLHYNFLSFLSRGPHLREVRMEVCEDQGGVVSLSSLGETASPCCRDS